MFRRLNLEELFLPLGTPGNTSDSNIFPSAVGHCDVCRFQSGFGQKTGDHAADSVAVVLSVASKEAVRGYSAAAAQALGRVCDSPQLHLRLHFDEWGEPQSLIAAAPN